MAPPSTRLRRVPLVGEVLDLPYVGPLVELFVDSLVFRGLVYGSLAFAVGFGLLWGVVAYVDPSVGGFAGSLLDLASISLPGPKLIAGWLFYMAHGVQLHVPTTFGSKTTNFLVDGSGKYLFVYPPLLLVTAGAAAAWDRRDRVEGVLVGACIAVGYALLFVAVSGHLSWEDTFVRTFQIQLVEGPSFLARAVAYPLVFGAVGGLLAVEIDLPAVS